VANERCRTAGRELASMEIRRRESPPFSLTQSERVEGWEGKAGIVRSFGEQHSLDDNFVGSVGQKCRGELRSGQHVPVAAAAAAYLCGCCLVERSPQEILVTSRRACGRGTADRVILQKFQ
jgi:hypothetical protein